MGDSADNDELVRDFLLIWERRDTEQIVAACTEDAVWHFRPLKPIIGRHAIRAFAQRYATIPGGPYEIRLQVATDRVVMNERTDHVTHNGKSITLATCGVFEIENGQIKAWRDYFDTSALNAT
jgi:limonene-1,2-epoxide hydrolase